MKKVMIVLMLFAGGIALAQRGANDGKRQMKDLSAEQIATLQTKKATLALDLSEAQQTEMKTLLLEKAKLRQTKMAERKALKESGERKPLTSEERYKRANERLDLQIAEKAKLKKILSEEQLAKWNNMHQKKKGRQRKGMKGKAKRHRERRQK